MRHFNYTFSQNLKKPTTIKNEWDLKRHFFTNHNDKEIESAIADTEQTYAAFQKQFGDGACFTDTKVLLKALTAYASLYEHVGGKKVARYFGFRHTLNAKDSVAEKRGNLADERLAKAQTQILFFEIGLGKMPKKMQETILKDPAFAKYQYFLKQIFNEAQHVLSEKEERILTLKSGPSSSMWVAGTEKILSNRTIRFKQKTIPLPEAIELINTLRPSDKTKIWELIVAELEHISEVAENEFNAIITNKKIHDELRGYAKPYSQTVQSYENNEASIEALIDAVSTRGFALSRRFYKLKARFHGLKKLPYVRKYDPIGKELTLSFEEAHAICRDVLYRIHPEYGSFYDTLFAEGRVDVFPKAGKRGGAFMSSDINQPPFVFLNHTNDFDSLSTLIHEMGHAIHSMRSKSQPPIYEDYSITTAETASTLFENILYETLLTETTGDVHLSLLHAKIQHSIASICRQVAFFNYERKVHEYIRKEGAATKEELACMLRDELRAYLGDGVEVTDRDGYSFVYISHFRYGFYVYTYAYGQLMSSLMAEKLSANPSYVETIDTFLSQGGSDTVENIFKTIGINTLDKDTFEQGLTALERDINAFEVLLKKKPRK